MIVWIDAQLSPALAPYLARTFGVEVSHVREFNLVGATDPEIFAAAGQAGAVVLTKDRDFVDLVHQRGAPPQIIWVTCGNTSNQEMTRILDGTFADACALLAAGEAVVEIKG